MKFELHPHASPIEQAFHAADAAWFEQLRYKFGDLANAARFQARGEGQPGTDLHAAYLAYCKARDAWLEEVEAENRRIAATLSREKLRAEEMTASANRMMEAW